VTPVPHETPRLPDFITWPTFPFEGDLRVRKLDPPVDVEPERQGEDPESCITCRAPDEEYIWVANRWRVRASERPTGLPAVVILESRSHLDLGDLPNLLAAELGVMTVRLERAIRSLEGVARVHVNRCGDGSAHLHLWFLARPAGRLQLRGAFLSLWDEILPPIPERQARENLALIAAWLGDFGGRVLAVPPSLDWQTPSALTVDLAASNGHSPVSGDDLVDGPVPEPADDVDADEPPLAVELTQRMPDGTVAPAPLPADPGDPDEV
jgi:diadenosine tetraphosphate (Ap4A) HIT family hydrolase